MRITTEWLKEQGGCGDVAVWFSGRYPDPAGEAEYQEVLNALASECREEWSLWLIEHAGPTQDMTEIQGDLIVEGGISIAGFLHVTGKIVCKFLQAGRGIKAGDGIEAGWGIKAGEDFGIYAGLSIRLSMKAQYAIVSAKNEPKNLILGTYRQIRSEE